MRMRVLSLSTQDTLNPNLILMQKYFMSSFIVCFILVDSDYICHIHEKKNIKTNKGSLCWSNFMTFKAWEIISQNF